MNNNRIRKITDNVDGNYTTDYYYDSYNRLSNAVSPSYSRNYNYDPWGNLTGMGANGATAYTINIAMTGGYGGGAPLTNRILSVVENGQTLAHTYDAAGNLTNDGEKTYAYDAAGRMTSVNGGALGSFGYNGDGKRVKKVESGATTYYVNSSVLGAALFELNGTGVVNRVHVTAGGKEIAQLATDGGFYWLHTDHLGTPRRMTNSTGVVVFRGEYDPHGNPIVPEWSVIGNPNLNNNKFTGYERDAAAELDFAQARHYKFGRGRFMQPDPANSQKLSGLNLYTYTYNDPINYVDLDGRDPSPYPPFPIWLPTPGQIYNPPSPFPNNSGYGADQANQSCRNNGGTPSGSGSSFMCFVPPYQPKPTLSIKVTTPGKIARGSCGKAEYGVEWGIQNATSSTKGWIIQHITITSKAYDQDNTPTTAKNLNTEFWEAWYVEGSTVYRGFKSGGAGGGDTYITKNESNGTWGSVDVVGSVKFIEGYSLTTPPWGAIPGDLTGGLPGILKSEGSAPGWSEAGTLAHTRV